MTQLSDESNSERNRSATYIKRGWGFSVGQDFDRAIVDIPIELSPSEYAPAGNVIGYIAGDPESRVAFLRSSSRVRVCVQRRAISESAERG